MNAPPPVEAPVVTDWTLQNKPTKQTPSVFYKLLNQLSHY